MRYTYIIALLFVLGVFSSCDRDDPDVEMTAVGDMAGEWYVTYQVQTGSGTPEPFAGGYHQHLTYNTAGNTDSMFVDEFGTIALSQTNTFHYKTAVGINRADRTFSTQNNLNLYDNNSVTINNGKVIIGGGRSRSGVKTDSIYYEVSLSDRPDTTFIVSGHRRTGFEEDEF
ncbi:hypothetical protein H8S95_07140 [Pontibacter sp. KCTC 32443]|nr:hypothetical protein [Pontibacter sp. KCTC 32443]